MPSNTNYVGARSIEELAAALQKLQYTPRSEEQRRSQSENMYRNQLQSALQSAQQQYQRSDLALQNQLTGLEAATNRQLEAQRQNTQTAISAADRQALSRGMQRSSYNNSRLNNILLKGQKAEADIQQNRTDTEQNIASQRALLAQELAQNQSQAQSQFENNVIAQMQQLEQQDYERGLAVDQNNQNVQLQLYQAQQADAQRAEQQRQFDAGQALTRDQMANSQNQFELNLALEREKLAEDIRQFNEQMQFNRDKLAGAGAGSGGSSGSGGTAGAPRANGNNNANNNGSGRDYGDLVFELKEPNDTTKKIKDSLANGVWLSDLTPKTVSPSSILTNRVMPAVNNAFASAQAAQDTIKGKVNNLFRKNNNK